MKFLIRESGYNIRDKYRNILFKIWKRTKPEITKSLLDSLGFKGERTEDSRMSLFNVQSFLLEFIGENKAKLLTKQLLSQNPYKIEPWGQSGYNFEFDVTRIVELTEYGASVDVLVDDLKGEVTLVMTNGETMNLKDACNDEEIGWEIEKEIDDIIFDFLRENITFKTGITITINKLIFKSKN